MPGGRMTAYCPLAVVVSLALMLALSACGPRPTIEASWPRADAERTVAKPDVPVFWPLSGRPAPDARTASSRPVLVAVSGVPAGAPRAGLEAADVVYEMPSASGSRLAALFQSLLPAACGPVIPAAPADAVIAGQYGAALAHTGASAPVPAGAVDAGRAARGVAYSGSGSSVLADVASLTSAEDSSSAPAALAFGRPRTQSEGVRVSAVDVPFSAGDAVEWRWDVGAGAFVRVVNGKPRSGAKGAPIHAVNVVVMWARPSRDTSAGLELIDGGRASVFMDGRRFTGTWKAVGDAPPSLIGDSGHVLALLPGNTWFEVVPTALNITLR